MAKKKAVEKKPRTTSTKKRQPLKKKAAVKKEDKRLSRRKRSDLKRYDQTLTKQLYDELSILAKQANVDLRAYVEMCLRAAPTVRKHLKENDLELPDRPARGNPATLKK